MWNEDNFDINCNLYVREAYESRKYAFVTDYVRLIALYQHGGVYMDTDVEVLKPLDQFLSYRAFTGCEKYGLLGAGTIGVEKEHPWIKDLLDDYSERKFILPDGSYDKTPNTQTITKITIAKYGWDSKNTHQVLNEGLTIFPFDVFCAKDYKTGKVHATDNTYTIHHFSGSWQTNTEKLKGRIQGLLGTRGTEFVVRMKKRIKGSS